MNFKKIIKKTIQMQLVIILMKINPSKKMMKKSTKITIL